MPSSVKKGCLVCQAWNRDDRSVKGEAQWTPIPDQSTESMGMDVFSMPEVLIGEEPSIVWSCVWTDTLATLWPSWCAKKGLLANKVAGMMVCHRLTAFGVPSTICSDRGSQFTGCRLKPMCFLMGIRHAKGSAYLSRSNCRAELTGRQLSEKLRTIQLANKRRNWFGEIWPALKARHNTPTTGGLSRRQIFFCREPLGRGVPLSGDGMAMDTEEFFERQETRARKRFQELENERAVGAKTAVQSTAHKFRVGDTL